MKNISNLWNASFAAWTLKIGKFELNEKKKVNDEMQNSENNKFCRFRTN